MDSDVDVAVVLIQPVPVGQDEWEHPERHANPRLLANIRREGKAL